MTPKRRVTGLAFGEDGITRFLIASTWGCYPELLIGNYTTSRVTYLGKRIARSEVLKIQSWNFPADEAV